MYHELADQFLDFCRGSRLEANTIKARREALALAGEDMGVRRLKDLTDEKVKEWVAMQSDARRSRSGKVLTGQTINARISHLRCFLNWCEDEGHRHRVNTRRLPRVKTVETRRQYWRKEVFFEVVMRAGLRDKVMLSILFDSMMRRFEVAKLRLCEINGREIRYVGKGGKNCVAYINENTRGLLDEYILRYGIVDYVFPSAVCVGQPVDPNTIYRRYRRCFARLGILGAHTHSSRHSGATDMELNDAPMRLISMCMNHSDVSTTQIYTHGFEERMMGERDRYKSVLGF